MTLLERADDQVLLFLNRFVDHYPLFDTIVVHVADSSIVKGGAFMAYFWWLWFRHDETTGERRRLIVTSMLGALAAAVLSRLLQLGLPYQARPMHAGGLALTLPSGVNSEALRDWSSFPSDHAVLFFALTAAIWYHSRPLAVVAGLWTVLFICLPRLYLGYHYLSDVAAGAVIGVAVMVAAHRIGRAMSWPDRIVSWEIRRRAVFYCVAFLLTYETAVLFYDVRHLASDGIHVIKQLALSSL